MSELEMELMRLHRLRFGGDGVAFSAPARVNLIGEHTDYTGGFVLPMAIGFHTVAVVSPRGDGWGAFYSDNYGQQERYEVASLGRTRRGYWSDYPAGVLWSLKREGISVGGFNMSLKGDVPLG